MKKARFLLFVGCALTLLASWVAAGEYKALKGGIPEHLPEVQIEDGKLVSPHEPLQRLHCIEKNLLYAIQWDAYPAARLTHLLQSGSVDVALPLSMSPQRDASFGKFIPLGMNSDLWVRLAHQQPAAHQDLVVGVMRGTIQAQIAQERGYQLMKVNEIEVLIKLLLIKRVDAIILTEKYFHANAKTWSEPIHSTLFRSEFFGVYFSKSASKEAVEAFEAASIFCGSFAQ